MMKFVREETIDNEKNCIHSCLEAYNQASKQFRSLDSNQEGLKPAKSEIDEAT